MSLLLYQLHLVPPSEPLRSQSLRTNLDPLGYKDESARCGDEIHCYPDAGHFITFPPGSSTQDSTAYYHPQYKVWLLMGGSPAGIAKAEREGNSALRAFLEKAFGE